MIRFEDSDGFGYEFRSDYGGREGARVELSYDPFDPAGTAGTSSDREPVAAIALGLLAAVLWFASANGFVARRDYLVVLES